MTKTTGRPFNEDELINQIGHMNILAISGGRVIVLRDKNETIGVELPCGAGYRVLIELSWLDTWTVTRQYVRKGTVFNKGSFSDVYPEQVGEIAYKAACWRNREFGRVDA